jgi:hypothetical protein
MRSVHLRSAIAFQLLALVCVLAAATPSLAGTAHQSTARSTIRPSLKAPAVVIEGSRFAVAVSIPTPRRATRVQLQFHDQHDYDFQSTLTWTNKATILTKGRRQVVFYLHADQAHQAWFRAVVAYRGSTPSATSAGVRVNYQHWFPLSSFSSYYSAGSPIDWMSFSMAGTAWKGWYASGPAAESRYTLGSGCVRVRAATGVTDASSDGATARTTLATIAPGGAITTFYTSPDLIAGKTVNINLPLANPYRFSISGQDTTPTVTDGSPQPRAFAALGDPQLLCHFN